MRTLFILFCLTFLTCGSVYGITEYEGHHGFSKYRQISWSWLAQLLPDSPVIVHVGAYDGLDICEAAKVWPKAEIFAIEANPRACIEMLKHIAETNFDNVKMYHVAVGDHNGNTSFYLNRGPFGNDLSYEKTSSLLPFSADLAPSNQGPKIEVPCMIFDEWCELNNIEHIDLLRFELEGFELQALQCSPNILKKVKVIYIQSFFSSDRSGMTNYFWLKDFLYNSSFVVLAHWYTPGKGGNALYVNQELFNSLQGQ